ncbi:paired amphipathic helix protein Sin3-like 2 [Quillaja saponaria]|uniref:Paired amphipathic helix protein Sin3-like 2 n=1 Tax=Quillaja saponaria TaxID=32244 RepID=A0AAD7P7C2_QUISA|nr:paired amphipathic helix protein Sin3-like 2 [Quillaja saponaria]
MLVVIVFTQHWNRITLTSRKTEVAGFCLPVSDLENENQLSGTRQQATDAGPYIYMENEGLKYSITLLKYQLFLQEPFENIREGWEDGLRTLQGVCDSDPTHGFICSTVASSEGQDGLKRLYKQASDFVENVRARLDNTHDFLAFFDRLSSCRAREFDSKEFRGVVTDCIGNSPDLMDEFEEFLESFNNVERPLSATSSEKSLATSTNNRIISPDCDLTPTPSYQLRDKY